MSSSRSTPTPPSTISTDGEKLTIGPAKPSERRRKFEAAQAKAHQQFSGAFQKLAE